jgi:hypothetical protein
MAKSIKLKDNNYIDSSGITHNRISLNNILNSLIPVVLYNNTAGTNGSITLAETAANFKYIDIFFRDTSQNNDSYVRVYNPNGKRVQISTTRIEYNNDTRKSRKWILWIC